MSAERSPPAPQDWREPNLAGFSAALQATATVLRRPAGSVLFREGQQVSRMFYVRTGEALLQRATPVGTPVLLQQAGSGSFIAEASLTSAKYHCDAVCRSACELLVFPLTALRQAIDDDANTRWAWIGRLSAQSRQLRLRVERVALKTVSARLMHLVATEGTDGAYRRRGNRKELAAELGITPEALYRTLATLQAEGKLSIDDKCLRWSHEASSS